MRFRVLFLPLFLALFFVGAKNAFAASITLSAPRQVTVGQTFQVVATVNGAEDVDTMRLQGTYSTNLLDWNGAAPGTVLAYVSPGNAFSEPNGTFYYGAFSLTERANGSARLATMTFKATSVGTALVRIVSGSHILSAGEEQLGSMGSASIVIVAPRQPTPPVVTPTEPPLVISSSSHPDQNAWYAEDDVEVSWVITGKPVRNVYVSFDQSPESRPTTTASGNSATFRATQDGVWYVHVRVVFQDGTSVQSDFRVQIDREPPHDVVPIADQTIVPPSIPNFLRFGTTDDTSGVAFYIVSIDGNIVTSTIFTTFPLTGLEPGKHVASVTAVDFAGNETTGVMDFELLMGTIQQIVKSIFFSPFKLTALALLLLAFGLFFLLILVRRRREKAKKRLKRERVPRKS